MKTETRFQQKAAILNQRRISSILIPLALTVVTSTCHANNFSYNFAEIGYSTINDFDIDGGVTLSASYDINYNVNLFGDLFFSTSSDSNVSDDIDVNIYNIGIGYHTAISDKTDVLGEIGLFNSSSDAKVGTVSIEQDSSGYTLAGGLRHKLLDKVEVNARFDHRNGDNMTDTSYTIGSRYYFSPTLSAGIDFNTGSDDGSESLTGSLRWNFR